MSKKSAVAPDMEAKSDRAEPQVFDAQPSEVVPASRAGNVTFDVSVEATSAYSQHPIAVTVSKFMTDMNDIRKTMVVVIPHVLTWLEDEQKEAKRSLGKFKSREVGDQMEYNTSHAGQAAELVAAVRKMEELASSRMPDVIMQGLFTHIFAEFDSFTGALLKSIYLKNDALLKGVEKNISLRQLLDFEDLLSVKKYLLEQEIDSFRRDSYVEQFSELEKKFKITLRKFPEWSEFVELTQRRNLIIHNGGVVSEQYILMCKGEGCTWKKAPATGDRLEIDPTYQNRALFLMQKVGFMLAHTLWRKVFPDELSAAHDVTNHSIYELLLSERWRMAAELGEFALTESMKKGISEVTHRMLIINTAIGLKFSKRESDASNLLRSVDWSASYRDFKLAVAVLSDDFDEASQIMRGIGKAGELVTEFAYHRWPLFFRFRASPQFLSAYEDIYKVHFSIVTDVEPKVRSNSEKTAASAQPQTSRSSSETRAASTSKPGQSSAQEPKVAKSATTDGAASSAKKARKAGSVPSPSATSARRSKAVPQL